MRKPAKPPKYVEMLAMLKDDPDRFSRIVMAASGPLANGKYYHWDTLRHMTPPPSLSREDWWFGVKFRRSVLFELVPLLDSQGQPFRFAIVPPIPESLSKTDQGAGGLIEMPDQVVDPATRERYVMSSLIRESITSSQLEGATTTRREAKDMLRSGREPQDKSERMIFNNYQTMQRIRENQKTALTPEFVCEIHRLVTQDTLDSTSDEGQFRDTSDDIRVYDENGEVMHTPPPASELKLRMAAMCDFANGKTPDHFVHPVVRAIILHFWLAYDHPFVDGNGRAARALFYWSMLHHGYWLAEFISISEILLRAPAKYARAYLHTESDENDLTYFIIYQLSVIQRAMQSLHDYIKQKTDGLHQVEKRLRQLPALNSRQRQLLAHALRHPRFRYTVESHRVRHGVVYETGRSDLLDLYHLDLLDGTKEGRTWFFTPSEYLEEKLDRLGSKAG